jgi:hypothetical protein
VPPEERISTGGRFWLADGDIIHGVEGFGVSLELAAAQEAWTIICKLAGGRRRGLLMDISQIKSMSREARAFFGRPAHSDVLYAVALKIGSPLSRALGNFFLGFNKPAMPMRLFSDEPHALDWLRKVAPP